MKSFVRTVEAGSFTLAAEQLRIAKSAVSRRVADLERRLGAQLLQRTTRRLTLTDAGRAFYEGAVRVLSDLADIEAEIGDRRAALSGTIRVAAPLSFGLDWLGPALIDFMDAHGGVTFDIDFSDRMMDLVAEGFDLAIRIGDLPDSSLVARRLAPIETVAAASPAYLDTHGVPEAPADLAGHRELAYSGRPNKGWHYTGPDGTPGDIEMPVGLRSTSGDFLREAAMAGHGVIIEPGFILCDAIRDGHLVQVLEDYKWPSLSLYAVYPPTRHLPARTRALIDFLAERFGEVPPWTLDAIGGAGDISAP
ncbi:MAG: LysR family transcriptional regulator [Pseudomonadota bacterium]